MCISRTTARSATILFSRITLSLQVTCRVGDYAILGGFTAGHQFCRIGAHSITAIGTVVLQDIPPFVTASGNTAQPFGINAEGLKRRGYTPETITLIKRAYKTLYKSGLGLEDAKRAIAEQTNACPELQDARRFSRSFGAWHRSLTRQRERALSAS